MKKNLFWSMLAMSGMLFATSCSQDELVNESTGEFVDAKFKIATPDGIGTRAAVNVGLGTTVNYVACAVYDADGEELTKLRQYRPITDKQAEYSIRLVKGQAYRVAFFAYCGNNDGSNQFYNLGDMTNITINNAGSNLEERDAFTNHVNVTAEESMKAIEKPVTLYRPFAQLNLGAYDDDIEAARKADVVVTDSKITVSNVYTAFNAYSDEVVGDASEVTFAMNVIPGQDLAVDTDNNENTPDETFEYLALNYLLVGDKDAEKNLTDVTFEWTAENGKTNSPATVFKNIPVQRNYRTNIIGYLLTNPAEFNITIDEKFKKPNYNVIYAGGTAANPDDLEDAMSDINNNAVKNAVIKIPAGTYASWTTGGGHGSTPLVDVANSVTETVTIQGEGESSVLVVKGSGVGALRAANGAKLIFKDMTILDKSESYDEGVWELTYLEFAGNLEFDNVTFKGGITLQREDNDVDLNATFNNCTFITEEESVYGVWVSDGTSTFSNCKFQGTRGLKMHEYYGSEITSVTIDACEFGPLSKKPGVAIGDLNAATAVTIKNSSFIGCQAGEQGKYIYETDTDVSIFTFVNSNNSVEEDPANVVKIGTKAELIAFQQAVNVDGNGFSGKTIKLTANIDLEGMTWAPVGQTGRNGAATHFVGTFDGQGYTISNFVITPDATYGKVANYAAGLFGFVDAGDAVIKNLKVDSATVTGHHWTAVICGYLTGTIQNCHVTNSSVTCTHANNDACGDKAGMIVGYTNHSTTTVKDCTAKDGTVKAGRDAGQIVGCNSSGVTVSGCSAENVNVSATGDCTGANIKNDIIGRQN
ncbi:DUF6562 domain-containing protein [Bacteroides uniformis]|uniref:DUF6562 domain-containing protein n=1 Tax=Bacteroides uniformis TaxID=820 RepID=UPI0039B3FC34